MPMAKNTFKLQNMVECKKKLRVVGVLAFSSTGMQQIARLFARPACTDGSTSSQDWQRRQDTLEEMQSSWLPLLTSK